MANKTPVRPTYYRWFFNITEGSIFALVTTSERTTVFFLNVRVLLKSTSTSSNGQPSPTGAMIQPGLLTYQVAKAHTSSSKSGWQEGRKTWLDHGRTGKDRVAIRVLHH